MRWTGTDVDAFRAAAASWLADHKSEAPSDYGAIVPQAELPRARNWQQQLADAGLTGLHWPGQWGGQGLTGGHTAAWLEECAKAQVPPFINMVGLVLTAEALLAYGTEEQKATHLPPLRTGERLWCQMFSEPGAGSDLAGLRTTARPTGAGWVLDGEKVWTSNGHIGDWGICLARTDPDVPAHAGISFFLVDMKTPGVEVFPLRQITGTAEFDQVVLTSVELPPESLLGPPGGGWAVAMATLTHERNHIGALSIRLGLRLDRLVQAARSGHPVLEDRAVQLWACGRALSALGAQQDRLGPAGASLMKLGVAELSVRVSNLATRLAGPAGQMEGPVAGELVATLGSGIAGGSTQVQKNIIGERLLALPREPRPGRT